MANVKNHPVNQVLITSGNQAVLAADLPLSSLAIGQIGFFNVYDNLSIDGVDLDRARHFYIAVGADPLGTTPAISDIQRSAGQHIQRDLVKAINARCYTPGRGKVIDITNFRVKCETEYGFRVEIVSGASLHMHGYNTPSKYYNTFSNCCTDDCATCPEGDCNVVALNLVNNVNADPEALLRADLLDYTTETVPGTPDMVVVPISGYAAWVAAAEAAAAASGDPIACLGVRLTGLPEKIRQYCSINPHYDSPRGVNMHVSLVEGFNCNGKVTTFAELVYAQGDGYDIGQMEYEMEAYGGGPIYKVSTLAGLPFPSGPRYADKNGKYLTIALANDLNSVVGTWASYENPEETILAIPCADTATRTAVGATLNAIFTGRFDSLVDDLAACTDCVNVNFQSAKTIHTDGIA